MDLRELFDLYNCYSSPLSQFFQSHLMSVESLDRKPFVSLAVSLMA